MFMPRHQMFQGFNAFMIPRHTHHLMFQRNEFRAWVCDVCSGRHTQGIPSFHCSVGCDYDMCETCMEKQNPTRGKFMFNHPHPLSHQPARYNWKCDCCNIAAPSGNPYHCMVGCNYDACETCVSRYATNAPPPPQVQPVFVQPVPPPQVFYPPPVACQPPPLRVTAPAIQPGKYFFIEAPNGLVVDVPNCVTAPKTELILWTKNHPASNNQLWTMDGNGLIHSKLDPNVCIDVRGAKSKPFTRVAIFPQHGKHNQQWYVNGSNIVSQVDGAGMVLDVEGGLNRGNHLVINHRSEVPSQRWVFHFI